MAEIGNDIDKAIALLQENDLVGMPTETVYGLAGNALSEEAILKIYSAKNRPKFDPLILHTNSIEKISDLVNNIPEKAHLLSEKFWPGPLTVLLDKTDNVPDLLTSGLSRVAVRVPNHPLALSLLSELDFPLAAPSANPFGYVSPTEAIHVDQQLGDKIRYVLDGGPCQIGLESTIIGFDGEQAIVHRLGGMKVESIEEVIGEVKIKTNNSSDPAAPGMLKSHYSPGRKLILGDIAENLKKVNSGVGVISFSETFDVPKGMQFVLSPGKNLEEAARNIFRALRMMDHPSVEVILSEYLPNEGLGRAVNDRLRRASA